MTLGVSRPPDPMKQMQLPSSQIENLSTMGFALADTSKKPVPPRGSGFFAGLTFSSSSAGCGRERCFACLLRVCLVRKTIAQQDAEKLETGQERRGSGAKEGG
jgi:hypothetical protein